MASRPSNVGIKAIEIYFPSQVSQWQVTPLARGVKTVWIDRLTLYNAVRGSGRAREVRWRQ